MTLVRPFAPGDRDQCIDLLLAAQDAVFASMRTIYGNDLFGALQPDWEADQAAQVEAWTSDSNIATAVALIDEDVVGLVVSSHETSTGMGSILTIAVHPREQGHGVGRRLLCGSLADLRAAGAAFVEAYVRDFPGHEAVRALLRSEGFQSRAVQPTLLYRVAEHRGRLATRPAGVRLIDDDDVEQCVRFGLDAFRVVYASFENLYGPELFARIEPDWETSQATYIRSAITASDDETLIHEIDGEPAGFVVLKMDDHGVADIELLAVDPRRQGNGIATTLNRYAFDRCQEASMAFIVVATANDEGHAPARCAYERAGFEPMAIQWDLQIKRL